MTGFRVDHSWTTLTQVEKHAAVQVLSARRLTKGRIAEQLGCDTKTVRRYAHPAAVPTDVLEVVAARLQSQERRGSLKRESDVYPARA